MNENRQKKRYPLTRAMIDRAITEIKNVDNHEFEVIGILEYNDMEFSEYSYVGMYISYYYAKDYMNTSGTCPTYSWPRMTGMMVVRISFME